MYWKDRTIDPSDPRWHEIDPYWKIPRWLYLNATVTNQFNKLLFEDGYRVVLLDKLASKGILVNKDGNSAIVDIIFTCDPFTGDEELPHYSSLNTIPTIYRIPHPKGIHNPFETEHPRVDITKYTQPLIFRAVIDIDTSEVTDERFSGKNETLYDIFEYSYPEIFNEIIEIMMEPLKQYFEKYAGAKQHGSNPTSCKP